MLRWRSGLALVRRSLTHHTLMDRRIANGATTPTIHTGAHRTATTEQTGSSAAFSLAPGPGITGASTGIQAMATVIAAATATAADTMATEGDTATDSTAHRDRAAPITAAIAPTAVS